MDAADQRFREYKEFFERRGEYDVRLVYYYDSTGGVSVEELYQHFKERMLAELTDALFSGKDVPRQP